MSGHGTEDKTAPSSTSTPLTHEDRIAIARHHFENKGYRVHSGLQFGCELVLYADSPDNVHSDFCVHVVDGDEGKFDWRNIQTLVRSMPGLKKTLILARVREVAANDDVGATAGADVGTAAGGVKFDRYKVDELAIATEHAPFRHKNIPKEVGTLVKRQPKQK